MNVAIKKYTALHEPGLIKCIGNFQDYLMAIDTSGQICHPPGYGGRYLAQLLKEVRRGHGALYVALAGERVVGYVAGAINELDKLVALGTNQVRAGRVFDLYVEPEFRKQGIGRRFLKIIEQHLKKVGCRAVNLEVIAPNKKSHALYRRLGYADDSVDMRKVL